MFCFSQKNGKGAKEKREMVNKRKSGAAPKKKTGPKNDGIKKNKNSKKGGRPKVIGRGGGFVRIESREVA